MQQVQTVKEFSTYAAAQFLRTAVFIDDRIYNRKTKAVEPEKPQKTSRKLASRNANTQNNEKLLSSPEDTDENKDFPSQQLVNSFAKKQIVCSLYQPGKSESFSNDSPVYELCLASDIVIIDWDLGGNPGEKALELISCLVHESVDTKPEQLRLILVYTSESDLGSIAVDVFDKLTKITKEAIEPQKEDEGLSMHSSNSRVVVLGKPGHRIDKYKSHEVTEKELAQKAIAEFSKLASGLLQGTVLLGLAKIRENSRKILSKFDSSLDPAFLTHRALLLPHTDASDQVIPLLMSELQSVLEDKLQIPILSNDLIKDWCNEWKPTNHAKTFIGEEIDIRKFAADFCLKGIDIKDDYKSIEKLQPLINKGFLNVDDIELFRGLSSFLHLDNCQDKNHEFAALMSLRTHYGNIDPILQLGTIVCFKEKEQPQYFLCLQPLCDSVRLSGKKNFIFCKLQSGDTKRKTFVIEENGQFKELFFRPSAANCAVIEFKADKNKRFVAAKSVESGKDKCFVNTSSVEYFWVAQLKPDHAQRAAEQFASNLSRVGLTESEWLRLMS